MALIQSEDKRNNEATKGTYLEGIFYLKLNSLLFYNSLSCCLIGLHVGQVRLIFALPDYLHGNDLPRYHACIEWFNPFCAPNANSKLHSVTCSHCNNSYHQNHATGFNCIKLLPHAKIWDDLSSCKVVEHRCPRGMQILYQHHITTAPT